MRRILEMEGLASSAADAPARARPRQSGAPGPARGDDRHANALGDPAGQRQVVARSRPVAIDAGHEELARPALDRLAGPGDRVAAGLLGGGDGPDPPFARACRGGIDRHDDRLRAELLR